MSTTRRSAAALISHTDDAYCQPDAHGRCTTCADEALPATVVEFHPDPWIALVDINGRRAEVDITLVDKIKIGQLLLVHGGVALGAVEDNTL